VSAEVRRVRDADELAAAIEIRRVVFCEEQGVPLHQAAYEALRGAILGGRLQPGSRLPSTRDLAAHTGDGPNVHPERAGRYLLVAGQGLPSQ